jgi:hypothetical protein
MTITASHTTLVAGSSPNPLGIDLGLGNNITAVLDGLAADLLARMIEDPQVSFDFVATPGPLCRGPYLTPASLEECHNKPANLTIIGVPTEDQPGPTKAGLAAGVNYLSALLAASFADLGIWHNNSIFINADFVNATLDPNGGPYVQKIMTGDNYSPLTPTPAVISMAYICHFQRRKSPLSFVICSFTCSSTCFQKSLIHLSNSRACC